MTIIRDVCGGCGHAWSAHANIDRVNECTVTPSREAAEASGLLRCSCTGWIEPNHDQMPHPQDICDVCEHSFAAHTRPTYACAVIESEWEEFCECDRFEPETVRRRQEN